MAPMIYPDPPELRVLSALASGAHTPAEVAAQVPDLGTPVPPVLDWAVGQGYAECLDVAAGPSYSLTEKGLHTVGLRQELSQTIDASGRVDFAEATRLVMQNWSAAKGAATDQAMRDQAGWLADDSARDHVTDGLNRAYAQGALTQDELGTRTDQALAARTMGELRAAGAGVVELPPLPPQGVVPTQPTAPAPSSWRPQVYVNPGLTNVRPTPLRIAGALIVAGIVLLVIKPVLGLVVLLAAVLLLVIGLRRVVRR
jgi:hypothetical protein